MWITRRERQWWWWGLVVLAVVVVLTDSAPMEEERGRLLGWGGGGGGGGGGGDGVLGWLFNPLQDFSSRLGEVAAGDDVAVVEEGRRRKDTKPSTTGRVPKQKNTKRNPDKGTGSHGSSSHGSSGHGSGHFSNVPSYATEIPISVTGAPIVIGGHYVGGAGGGSSSSSSGSSSSTVSQSYGSSLMSYLFPFMNVEHSSNLEIQGGLQHHNPGNSIFGHGLFGYGTTTTTTQKPPKDKDKTPLTTTEVMVLRYPSFIKAIGKGFSEASKALRRFGENLGDRISNSVSLHSVPTLLGEGVSAIVPLHGVDEKFPYAETSKPTASKPSSSKPSSTSISHPSFSHSYSSSSSLSPSGINSGVHVSSSVDSGNILSGISNGLHGLNQGISNGLQGINQGLHGINQGFQNLVNHNNLPSLSSLNPFSSSNFPSLPSLPGVNVGSSFSHSGSSLSHTGSFSIGNGGGGGGGKPVKDPQADFHKKPGCC